MELQDLEHHHGRQHVDEALPPAGTAAAETTPPPALTRARMVKITSAAFCFFNAGVNDGSLGALIPYILDEYEISTGWMFVATLRPHCNCFTNGIAM